MDKSFYDHVQDEENNWFKLLEQFRHNLFRYTRPEDFNFDPNNFFQSIEDIKRGFTTFLESLSHLPWQIYSSYEKLFDRVTNRRDYSRSLGRKRVSTYKESFRENCSYDHPIVHNYKFPATFEKQEQLKRVRLTIRRYKVKWDNKEETELHFHDGGTYTVEGHTHEKGTFSTDSHTHEVGTFTVSAHLHVAGTLTVESHSHEVGTFSVAGHVHAVGTLTVSSHSHDKGTYSASSHYHEVNGTADSTTPSSAAGVSVVHAGYINTYDRSDSCCHINENLVGDPTLYTTRVWWLAFNATGYTQSVTAYVEYPSGSTDTAYLSVDNGHFYYWTIGESSAYNSSGWFHFGILNASYDGFYVSGTAQNIYTHTHGSHTHGIDFNSQYTAPGISGTSAATQPGLSGTSGNTQPGFSGTSGATQPGLTGSTGTSSPSLTGTSGATQPGFSGTSGTTQPAFSGTSANATAPIERNVYEVDDGASYPIKVEINGTVVHTTNSLAVGDSETVDLKNYVSGDFTLSVYPDDPSAIVRLDTNFEVSFWYREETGGL
ncbi:hypothetical protein J7J18_04670 [bacterium]|nr:hypothetical protein [bacterium]